MSKLPRSPYTAKAFPLSQHPLQTPIDSSVYTLYSSRAEFSKLAACSFFLQLEVIYASLLGEVCKRTDIGNALYTDTLDLLTSLDLGSHTL